MSNFYYDAGGDITVPADDGSISVLVNTVNCVGAHGAGVAKALTEKYPSIIPDYKALCKNGQYKPGLPQWHRENDDLYILNMPTKNEWRKDSEYSWVAAGMLLGGKMARELASEKNRKVTMRIPQPGCGNGGLDWPVVARMMRALLPGDESLRIVLCGTDLTAEDAVALSKRVEGRPVVAGIGSREAPDDQILKMREIGRIGATRGWLYRSGDAIGSDAAFRDGFFSAPEGHKGGFVGYLANEGKRDPGPGSKFLPLEPWTYAVGGRFHDQPERVGLTRAGARTKIGQKGDASAALISRNTFQLLGDDGRSVTDAVICYTEGGSGSGGTGQAIRIANYLGIPVIDLGLTRYNVMSAEEICEEAFSVMRKREAFLRVPPKPISEAPEFCPRPVKKEAPAAEASSDPEQSEERIDFFGSGREQESFEIISRTDAVRLKEMFDNQDTRVEAVRELIDLSGERDYGVLSRILGTGVSAMSRAVREAREESVEP